MKEYIERSAAMESILGLTIADPAVAQYADTVYYNLQRLPAADVVEVRHGYWIDHHSGGSFCSACKRWVPYSHHPKYCETCGARMDKEDDHEAG